MNESDIKIDQNLFQLVLSLQMAAMQNMGKIMSPISGKVERNLEQARVSIDMLNMISEKTKGNLNKEEDRFLGHILHELRLNYMDELNKPEPKADEKNMETSGSPETKPDSDSENKEYPEEDGDNREDETQKEAGD